MNWTAGSGRCRLGKRLVAVPYKRALKLLSKWRKNSSVKINLAKLESDSCSKINGDRQIYRTTHPGCH